MAKNCSPIDDARAVVTLLIGGDRLACTGLGWRLVHEDAPVTDGVVHALKSGIGLNGKLVPMGDQLPGMPKQMAQTWRWARQRQRAAACA